MKFKNVTEKPITIRVDDRMSNYVRDLVTVKPGKVIELKKDFDVKGLELVVEEPKPEEVVEEPKPKSKPKAKPKTKK